MIKLDRVDVYGWEAAIRGMRNPMNSWDKSDSQMYFCEADANEYFELGENDGKLMKSLSKAGSDHAKFLRMINVTVDITAPLYWWKEFDTYKVGTVANSCSTMHKIHEKEFTMDDFSCEHLFRDDRLESRGFDPMSTKTFMWYLCGVLNSHRTKYLETKDKKHWWQMIQLLPSSYNQKRTVQLNYEVLNRMYYARRNHKLDEWVEFCKWIEDLPYFQYICIYD
jgi:hypothetical protein